MRPLGGALFGSFGDEHGSKNTMMITVTGISAITFLTGLLPTWNTVGIIAPILLNTSQICTRIVCRGEWASGSSITMEIRPSNPWIAFRFPAKWIYLWISYGVDSFPDSITYLYRRILCRSWLETNVLYSYWTRTSISIN